MAKKTKPTTKASPAPRTYPRFAVAQRIEHVVMLLSFTLLAITGLPQKFATNDLSIFLIRLVGGIENMRTIHHVAAIVLMLSAVYHIIAAGYNIFVLRRSVTMLPTLKDVKDAWQAFVYNIGLRKARPLMGRYTFEEKAEYWALIWGTLIMALTGFLMWNPITSARLVPGEFIPAAKAAHGAEAILAVLAIIVWHMYGVHLRRFNKSMWTGDLTEEEMLHEHPLELAAIKSGQDRQLPDAATLKKRQMIYYPIAAVLGVAMLAGIYGFVNSEQTALTTVVEQRPTSSAIYVPRTPTPLPTPAPTSTPLPTATPGSQSPTEENPTGESPTEEALNWSSVSPILEEQCGACHGDSATAGLNATSYAGLMAGGASGPAISPGDAAASLLIKKVKDTIHPGKFSPEELQVISDWINAGAPE
jgi:cytochrome b subunit of formate dehydrogenase